jgi:hypothetical protein
VHSLSFIDQSSRAAGWSAHELELFSHAAELLSHDGFCVETDYGLTDEGEPWFVFCDADSGDVFGHFARIQEEYIASIQLCRCAMTAWELSELLGRFLRRHGIAWSTVARPIVRNADRLAAFGLAILHCA